MACSPNEPKYVDHTTKVIKLCKDWLEKKGNLGLWGAPIDEPTTMYDECGLLIEENGD